jgi:hypothetical protein
MILRGWKSIALRAGRCERWCQRWHASGRIPRMPLSFVNGRVEAMAEDIDAWAIELLVASRCTT